MSEQLLDSVKSKYGAVAESTMRFRTQHDYNRETRCIR